MTYKDYEEDSAILQLRRKKTSDVVKLAKRECDPNSIIYFNPSQEDWKLEPIFEASRKVDRIGHVVVHTDSDIKWLLVYNKLKSTRNIHVVFLDDKDTDSDNVFSILNSIED
jgi:hypothetical protein